ncbi:DUF1996 domain-containing protein [Kitasatospora azatica]|uniref:DUF1996 domain-containing protein n=1 Tax=Kitasatospora azatica TaxID=58347 RepID=UPI00056589BA|nr:DUF1996 domain-containing protein [Kitasatospora azatica]
MALPVGTLLCVVLALGLLTVHLWPKPPGSPDYVRITEVGAEPPTGPPGPDASTGSYTEDCGRNQQQHRNTDNVVISPGNVGGAHHVHDYVGNLSTNALSTDQTLAAAGTSCVGGDLSSYYWPVLRRTDRGASPDSQDDEHGNSGEILDPESVSVEFLGNPWSQVVPMPRFLRLLEGDPTAGTDGGAQGHARWGCSGFPDRATTRYPLCPGSSLLTRTLDFPSCWDGRSTDSSDHRTQAVFPGPSGVCPRDTFAIPHLRVTVGYRPPPGRAFALDAFPEQQHDPTTDHGVFIDVMTDSRMASVVACLNQNRNCRESG